MSLHPTLTKLDQQVLAIVDLSPCSLRARDVARVLIERQVRNASRGDFKWGDITTLEEVKRILRGLAHFGHVRETRNGWYSPEREPLR